MRVFIFLIMLMHVGAPIFSQTLDDFANVVVCIDDKAVETRKIGNKEYEVFLKAPGDTKYIPSYQHSVGTGFLTVIDGNLFLVTAKHVSTHLSTDAVAVLRFTGDSPISFPLTQLAGGLKQYQWRDSKEADVAVLQLKPSDSILKVLQGHFFPAESLEATLSAPSREAQLVLLGFPLGIGAEGFFSPVSKIVRASSGLVTIDGKTYFLLDTPSIGGYSGAPLFIKSGAQFREEAIVYSKGTKCVGLITATLSDETGGKLATVVPSYYILALIKP